MTQERMSWVERPVRGTETRLIGNHNVDPLGARGSFWDVGERRCRTNAYGQGDFAEGVGP